MMATELFERVVSPGGKVSYRPYAPPVEEPTVYDLTDDQMLTVAGSLGVTLLILFERHIPPHKRNARKIKAVQDAVLSLYQDSGAALDPEIADWVCKCWDKTMHLVEFGGES